MICLEGTFWCGSVTANKNHDFLARNVFVDKFKNES